MTIEEYFGDWCKVVDTHQADSIMRKLFSLNKQICPLPKNVFKAFTECDFNNLRVVLIGQDPYFTLRNGEPVATGIAFANSADTPEDSFSPSLEILRDSVIDFTTPSTGVIFDQSLEMWEEQGVLCLNSALTCEVGKPGSHALLWRPFLSTLLTNLSRLTTSIVYVLMGNQAQTLEPYINKRFNHVIRCRHPSYYARTQTRMPSDIWKQINDILIGIYGYGIKWYKEY